MPTIGYFLTGAVTFTVGVVAGNVGGGSTGGEGDTPEEEDPGEYWYRAMSMSGYERLKATGGLSLRDKGQTESFVTPYFDYAYQLADRHPDIYQVMVIFKMQSGTREALKRQGAISNNVEKINYDLRGSTTLNRGHKHHLRMVV